MKAVLSAIREGRLLALPEGSKEECLRILSAMLPGPPGTDTSVIDRVLERETQANTYLGYGIACPHGRFPEDGDITCAVGWSRKGVEYGNEDGTPVRLMLLYTVPASASRAYLDEITLLARAIQKNRKEISLKRIRSLEGVRKEILRWIDGPEESEEPGRGPDRMTAKDLLLPEVVEMMESNRLNELREFLSGQLPAETADLLEAIPEEKRILFFRILPRQLADEVFINLETDSQNVLLERMAQEESRQALASLPPDDRTALFEELPARVTRRLLGLLSDADRRQALTLLSYPENSVGRLMTDRYVRVRAEWTVEQALEHIRKVGTDSETLVIVYITDDQGVLKDELRLRKIILADPSTTVSSLLDGRFASLHSFQTREEAVQVFRKHDLYALPVVDSDGVLLGIVTADDILDVAEEEATVDIHKGSAIRPLTTEYLQTSTFTLYARRVVWLVALVFVNIFMVTSISRFEKLIESVVALVFFLPLLIGSAGNAGAQSATLVIRGMALGQLRNRDFLKAVLRESLVATGLGLSMATAVFFLAWWRSDILVASVVSFSMVAVVWIASLTGMTLPFLMRLFRIDPAVASGPLVTSIADILGVIIYLSIASTMLGRLS